MLDMSYSSADLNYKRPTVNYPGLLNFGKARESVKSIS